jgi:hypothetical protein
MSEATKSSKGEMRVRPNEQMNKNADALTKEARKLPPQEIYHKFSSNLVALVISDQYVTSRVTKHTSNAYHSIALKEYFHTKHNWSQKVVEKIWWQIQWKAINSYDSVNNTCLRKFINDYRRTKKRDQDYDQQKSSLWQDYHRDGRPHS